MLALRADVSGAPDFAELVRRVRARAIAAFDRRGVRFDRRFLVARSGARGEEREQGEDEASHERLQ